MAAETSGRLRLMLRVRRVLSVTSRGMIVEWAGRRRTSSNVSARWIKRMAFDPRSQKRIIQRAPLGLNDHETLAFAAATLLPPFAAQARFTSGRMSATGR
jgi:hypothetical protein